MHFLKPQALAAARTISSLIVSGISSLIDILLKRLKYFDRYPETGCLVTYGESSCTTSFDATCGGTSSTAAATAAATTTSKSTTAGAATASIFTPFDYFSLVAPLLRL